MPRRRRTPLVVHVVSHTHWDREWYQPAGRFRQRLVALVDELLDDPPSGNASFLLDGQTIVIDDYLAVRPERRAALAALLQRRALEAGPWLVLPDELIPSGEALVRNLLAGRRTLRSLGAESAAVLYSPDAFGHPAALPAVAAGFGCTITILWRGYGGAHWPDGDTVRWVAPDGSETLLYHLPPSGYEFGADLPATADDAQYRWSVIENTLAPRATLGAVLLTNGADHHARQRRLDASVAALARAAQPHEVRASSLAAFAADLAHRAARAKLPQVRGELRDSYGYTWTLPGTLATRAHQKRRNAIVERLLMRDVEPWVVLAARRGGPSRRALVHAAWRMLLACHPHDTLCGCSIDVVARAMDARLDDAHAQADGLRADALAELAGHDPDRRVRDADQWRPVVIVRNRAARPRGGIAELDVRRLRRHVPVGPYAGGRAVIEEEPEPFALDDGRVPFQVLDDALRHDRLEWPRAYPWDDLVDAARVVAWVPEVPGYGTTSLTVDGDVGEPGRSLPAAAVRAGETWLDNERLRVRAASDGTVHLGAPELGIAIPSLLAIEDVGDVGDLYTHSARSPVLVTESLVGAHVAHAGPLRGEIRARWSLDVPAESDREARSATVHPLAVRVALTLDAGAPLLRVHLWGENRSHDHRVRLVVRTGLTAAAVHADAAFGVVQRFPITASTTARDETPPPTAPLARYVTVSTPLYGVTVYSDGLAEYEVLPHGDVAITLVRAVGELSRNTLPERPGHAGWPAATPEAQCIGPFEASFAIFPHGPRDAGVAARIEQIADDVLVPLVGHTMRDALEVPPVTRGVELDGAGLAFSACTESEDGEWIVLRCVNRSDAPVTGAWRCGFPVHEAWRSRLDETRIEQLASDGATVPIRAAPHEIVTVLVR